MCTANTKIPKAQAPEEPMKNAAQKSSEASDNTAKDQQLRRGLASTYTRTPTTAAAGSDTIGG
jgi:hypothetical protein